MASLDKQESVANNLYFPLTVSVKTPDGNILECRSYQQCNNPEEHVKLKLLPQERRPSPQYLYLSLKSLNDNINFFFLNKDINFHFFTEM